MPLPLTPRPPLPQRPLHCPADDMSGYGLSEAVDGVGQGPLMRRPLSLFFSLILFPIPYRAGAPFFFCSCAPPISPHPVDKRPWILVTGYIEPLSSSSQAVDGPL